jgi:DeoR family fructose operon transcriptional repressor
MLESARRVVAMVDQSKFGNDQMFAYAALDEIDVLVTDARADDDALTVLAEHDLEVRRA